MKAKQLIMLCTTSGAVLCGCNNVEKVDGNAHFTDAEKDTTVLLGDDFYQYSNGGWKLQHPLPSDKSRLGTFDILNEDNEDKLKAIVDEISKKNNAEGTAAQKIADLYACSMDTAKRNELGASVLNPYFEMIDNGFADETSTAKTMVELQKIGVSGFFYFGQDVDAENSSMTIAGLGQTGIGLPERDYYFMKDERAENIRAAYKVMLNKYAELLRWENAEARVSAIYALEERIADKMYTRTQRRDPNAVFNKRTVAQLKEEVKGIDWDTYLAETGANVEFINVAHYNYLTQVGEIINSTDKNTLKDYYKMRMLRSYASDMSDDFVNTSFDFYGKVLSGTPEMRPLWKRSLSICNSITGDLLGQLFVEKHFPAAAKERMLVLIENLRTAFAQRIDELTWMGDSTKTQAKDKLAAITVKVGYPDKWEDYTDLKISKELNLVENEINATRFAYRKEMEKIGKPVDKGEWFMTPQTVNAYYNPSANEIVFPAGILQPPFFYANGDDAVNYGAIGVVIGHEMTHGFDDQGCQFDKEGNLKNWWTEEDAKRFKEAAQKLIDRYASFIAIGDLHANGENTIGENIADLGGLSIAYQAYQNSLEGKAQPAPIDGQTDQQRFCYAYSRIWATNIREEALYQQVNTDPHSPAHLRVNVPLPLVDYFYEAFGIDEKAKMYVPKEERIAIW